MTGTQLFALAAAIYFAPHVPKWAGNSAGVLFLALAFILRPGE